MLTFSIDCQLAKNILSWLTSDGGGGKSLAQSKQITQRVLKILRFCCADADEDWEIPRMYNSNTCSYTFLEIPMTVVDFCIGSVDLLGKFFEYLRNDIEMAPAGCIGYLNALGHLMDFRKLNGITDNVRKSLYITETYISRIRRTISKRMKLEWNTVLDVENLESQGCWTSYDEMKQVIPYHENNFEEIMHLCKSQEVIVPPHKLSFATAFVAAMLFLEVKASRPMIYQHLTLKMVEAINSEGIIDQTIFKTSIKYGFDSLVFEEKVLSILHDYIESVRPRLNPKCAYVLITRNGNQMSKLSSTLGKLVFEAIGKYIHPTRLRQIIETSSGQHLTVEEQQIISEYRKHSSTVAKIHYKKLRSRDIARKAKKCMEKISSCSVSIDSIPDVPSSSDCEMIEIAEPIDDDQNQPPSSSKSNCNSESQSAPTNDCTITKVTMATKKGFSHQEDLCIKNKINKDF